MAESGEAGVGRMAEPLEIAAAADDAARRRAAAPLAGKRVLVTSGPTHEPIDPVRYIANRSSGKQGHAIAARRGRGRRRGDAGRPARSNVARSARRRRSSRSRRAREMLRGGRSARCRPTSRSSPPRSPTGASANDRRAEDQERRGAARRELALVENPDILATGRASQDAAAEAGDRLRRRDRERRRPTPRRSSRARAATGSSPTTCRRRPASWAATATPSIWSPRDGVETLAAAIARTTSPRMLVARIAAALGARRPMRRIDVSDHAAAARRRPAAAVLSKRARRRPRSAGRGAGRRAAHDCARRARADPDRHRDRAAAGHRRRRCGRAPGLPRITASPCSTRPAPSTPTIAARSRCCLINLGSEPFAVTRGMRIAQLVVAPVMRAQLARGRQRSTKRRVGPEASARPELRSALQFCARRVRDRSLLPFIL